jgi:hypothetical protein
MFFNTGRILGPELKILNCIKIIDMFRFVSNLQK